MRLIKTFELMQRMLCTLDARVKLICLRVPEKALPSHLEATSLQDRKNETESVS